MALLHFIPVLCVLLVDADAVQKMLRYRKTQLQGVLTVLRIPLENLLITYPA
jgi:hypothetical protein